MRVIDADALYKDICDSLNEMTKIGIAVDGEWLWGKLNDSLENAPTIEFEIIHCKDCKHWSRESICDGFCSEDCMRHDEDFYCADAERRTDGIR